MKNEKGRPKVNPMNSIILGLPKASQTSQSTELGRFEGGSNELQNHNNGATKLHTCTTIATLHVFFSPLFFFFFFFVCGAINGDQKQEKQG
jgi:hypothetical protein